ncbi:hypothetical protein BDW71DRAFT_207380 [Aspergillus fruticulosus]
MRSLDLSEPIRDGGHIPNGNENIRTNGSNNSISHEPVQHQQELHPPLKPIAICGMSCRLPGGIDSPQQLWDFLLSKGDARSRVPPSRYNIDAFYSAADQPGTIKTQYGYFLDSDIASFDSSLFSMSPMELARCDPQQRLLLEVARECIEDAGETDWKGRRIGVYVGNFGEDWNEMLDYDDQQYGVYRLAGSGDFALSNRVSYEMDLQGPSMTIRTACSSSLVSLHEACLALARGDCESAIVAGTSLILTPSMTVKLSEQGVLSPDGSCKTFSSEANGYGRGEAVNGLFIKPLADALRDGNPVRAVIRATATNHDGKTPGMTYPSLEAQEALMRQAYKLAGISDASETAFVECHGTGTLVGDPVETNAVARVFGDQRQTYIGSVKPNLGHSEGASGLTSVIKVVLALEHRTIPPNIKLGVPNPKIPFESARLTVPLEPTPWPSSVNVERASVNSFGIGGNNCHVILESAASHSAAPTLEESSDTPQLLVYSAGSPESLRKSIDNHAAYLSRYPERIEDLAFTLANRRQHLPYRGFVVSSREKPGIPSQPTQKLSSSTGPPTVIMVFTGQGAQWPQMGRALMRSNPTFRTTIQSLDQHLKNLGEASPDWTIEAELRKPAKRSRLDTAELSQPLCTALQIALVDSLACIGVVPDAVVGHSSGEIAAAYAAGALTAQEAITAAFHRGVVANKQSRAGAMAAIGMGWAKVKPFLIPGADVACENSPRSVTVSGDADKVEAIVAAIQAAHPDVLARLLKVDKAYHSYHMTEVGDEYHRLVGPNVPGRSPTKLFFSSVTGDLLGVQEVLDAKYWQRNLESPVLFSSAVSRITEHPVGKNALFLEVGPHSALAGPVRQILTERSVLTPYVATLLRGADCTESFLSAIGKLYTLHVPINFRAMMPQGACLSELPRYPWNRQNKYWFENRVTHDWRHRQYPCHDLLGVRVTECADFAPTWRSVFHLDNAPWVRDHKVNDDTVFPFAAYVAMAGEAVRQISDAQEGFTVRNVEASTALVVSEGTPVEIVTTMQRDDADSTWWKFTIGSHNGHMWTKHCGGQVTALQSSLGSSSTEAIQNFPRAVPEQSWYDVLRRAGLDFGPRFQCLEDIRASTTGTPGRSTATIRTTQGDDADKFHQHPVTIDAALQLMVCAAAYGIGLKHRNNVATRVGELAILRSAESSLVAVASGSFTRDGSVRGSGHCIAGDRIAIRISGVEHTVLEAPRREDSHAAAHVTWGPHIDYVDSRLLIRPTLDKAGNYMKALDELAQVCILHSWTSISTAVPPPHLLKYRTWLERQAGTTISAGKTLDNPGTSLNERIQHQVEHLMQTPAAPAARALLDVNEALGDIFAGKIDALDVLSERNPHGRLYAFLDATFDISPFLTVLAHTRPNLRVLELGAGKGATTPKILKALGSSLYKYTFSDVSPIHFEEAKEQLKGLANVEFSVLDIGKNLEEQGYANFQYDLIISRDVIHLTDDLSRGLDNLRSLTAPGGRLLFQEVSPSAQWMPYVLGLLPKWWSAALLDEGEWERKLQQAGFDNVQAVPDVDSPFQLSATFVAQPRRIMSPPTTCKKVTLLCPDKTATSHFDSIVKELQVHGFEVTFCTLDGPAPRGADIISLLDQQGSCFFEDLSADVFARLQGFMGSLSSDVGIFWILPHTSKHPQYAQTQGFARTMRSELGVDFAVCETDVFDQTALDVFERFQERREFSEKEIGALNVDMEYAIRQAGQVHIPRIYPLSLVGDLASSSGSEKDIFALTTKRPGRLSALQWEYRPVPALGSGDVEIEVYSVGLNRRDISLATGSIQVPACDTLSFGHEAAGIIRRVGHGVKDLKVGDRVMALGQGTLASVSVQSETCCVRLPEQLGFNDGALVPIAFITAMYALRHVARLTEGQSVLVQNGCSRLGLAAIQIARLLGATVFATVDDDEQAALLVRDYDIPSSFITCKSGSGFSHRQEVDVVLTSPFGRPAHAQGACVAEFGVVIETERPSTQMRPDMDGGFPANLSYYHVDIARIQACKPTLIKELFSDVLSLLTGGQIRLAPPTNVFDAYRVQDAFAHLQSSPASNVVVELRGSNGPGLSVESTVKRTITPRFSSSASYLLVGGLGGLGRSISTWMVQYGARCLVFLSRSAGQGPGDQAFINELASMGCKVHLVQGSVSDLDVVTRAIQTASATAPLKGILQMSMVLRDQAFSKMSWEDWEVTTKPKTLGTWNLHNATLAAGISLDFFTLFSSISGVIGQPGQASYASANTFLDAFCAYRQEAGLAASVIAFGPIDGIGVFSQNEALLRQLKSTGFYCIGGQEVLDGLAVATATSLRAPSTTPFILGFDSTIPLNSEKNRLVWRRDPRMAVYHNRKSGGSWEGAGGGEGSGSDRLKAFIARARKDPSTLETPETLELLAREIGLKVLNLLSKAEDELNTSLGLADLGMDSLVAIEMRMWWKQTFQFDISVLEMMGKGSVEVLARHAADGMRKSWE